jgi:hypothetical protein
MAAAVLFVGGGVLAAAGATLLLLPDRETHKAAALGFVPFVGQSAAGVFLDGAF